MLSVIIPSYRDPLLHKTIDSLLKNARGEIEVIPVLDGYWPVTQIKEDRRIKIVHLGKNRGMRGAINAGVAVSRGKYIMRTDQHCMFGEGYDRILTENCPRKWIVTAPQYFLDPIKWEVMNIEPVLTQKLVIQDGRKFSGQRWRSRDEKYKNRDLVETMAMQGSMWVTRKKCFVDIVGELQTEGYGQMYQDSHEMVFKYWKRGGRLILNKKTWYAHKHRSFTQGRHEGTKENPSLRRESGLYALKVWRDYYEKEIKKRWGI